MDIQELQKQAQEAIDSGDLAKAKELLAQIKAIKESEEEARSLVEELRSLTEKQEEEPEAEKKDVAEGDSKAISDDEAEQSTEEEAENDSEKQEEEPKEEEEEEAIEAELEKEKGEERSMKPIIEENKLVDFANFIRTEGTEKRSLDTTSGAVLVPVDVATNVLELKDGLVDLTKYITVENVGTGQGKFPVAKRAQAILATKAELAEIAEINDPLFLEVDYKVETRIGQIAFSNEVLEDAEIDVVAYAEKQMQRMVRNTNNKGVLDVLAGFAKTTVVGTDGLKSVINVALDPELDVQVIVNQDAYQYLDTLKDAQGRYLLQDSIAAASGKSLFGKEVIVVSNKVAPTPKSTVGYIFAGDLKEAVFMAKRKDITAEWEKFDRYSKGLAVGVRSDYKAIDTEAGFNVVIATV